MMNMKRAEAFRLGREQTLSRERMTFLLSCNDRDIESTLSELGFECCSACGTWKTAIDHGIADPCESGSRLCLCNACSEAGGWSMPHSQQQEARTGVAWSAEN